ncbi:CHAP domain-containing protein [Staphylococcus succinus]|jgi:surface antigen|uniref:CHAP domain-containing protein n=1 Tax=Staphylococcus succinus TaxID=61015 RepID=A0A9Q6MV18_9STAP|nr:MULTISPECIES: CHAP domain-containing protein [Staphylococcus]MBU0438198.1 CHAP domain-containing protein [Staphylococcus succinus]MDH9160323.1 CHAP domain-containing protein [Staphylococcus succinus]MEB7462441.1 CHAP domain-containing protein [Staphylococcus succinus]MEB8123292.1 CHAP domain-containing protein [Staphylococcus succinus]MEB8127063.1 CHAP domain-containing protein [Staphylococcus succinus]
MKKLLTATTLTAGIGAAMVGLDHGHDANAAEQTQTTNESTTQSASGSSANLYTSGQCTWYVFDKVDGSIGSTWGNANNWASAASAAGYTVNNSPEEGSILQSTSGPYGHVAYVEDVNSDGSVHVSEMNYNGGPYSVSERTIPAGEAGSYNYIHVD